jgi:hypothetical protein
MAESVMTRSVLSGGALASESSEPSESRRNARRRGRITRAVLLSVVSA